MEWDLALDLEKSRVGFKYCLETQEHLRENFWKGTTLCSMKNLDVQMELNWNCSHETKILSKCVLLLTDETKA